MPNTLPEGWFMRTKYSEADLHAWHLTIAEGTPIAKVLEATGASYSPVWCYHTWCTHQENGTAIDLTGLTATKASERIAKLRATNLSWGAIACLVSRTESACRRAYSERTGIEHEGTRTGSGGRFWGGDATLYAGTGAHGNRATHGPQVPAGTTAEQAAELVAASPNEAPVKTTKGGRKTTKK